MPGPAWVPTTGPISVAMSGCSVTMPSRRSSTTGRSAHAAVGDGEPLERGSAASLSCRCQGARTACAARLLHHLAVAHLDHGLMLSSEPSMALAPPMRPPFTRCSSLPSMP